MMQKSDSTSAKGTGAINNQLTSLETMQLSNSKTTKPNSAKLKTNRYSELLVANTYRLNKRLCTGAFSEIRVGEDIKKGTKVAAKLESITNNKLPLLSIEYKVYQRLRSERGFPLILHFGQYADFNVLVMQLLGQNLEQVFDLCNRQFSLKTILYIAIQLITRFECIHRHGIVYRDVKPENFLWGLQNQANMLYVIDFGLSKPYLDPNTGQHIPAQVTDHLVGTGRYMSLNAHRYLEHSRRDDLESIGYVLLYLLRQGKLPWSGFKGFSLKERYQKVYEYKYSIPIETLCHGFPVEFSNYLRYARSLEFDEEPCYKYMQGIFVELFQRENFKDDAVYDWSCKIKS